MPAVVSRCLSAAGLRFPVILSRQGFRPSYDRPTGAKAPDHDGVSVFRTREIRPEWAPSLPRDRRCSCGPPEVLARRLPPSCGTGPAPRRCRHLSGAAVHEASARVHAIRPPGLPLTCDPPDDTGSPWALPPGFAPARTGAWNYAADLHSIGPPICEFTRNMCDLTSHQRLQRHDPGGDPQRRDPAGSALPVGGRLQPARVGMRRAPHQAQEARRQDLGQGLRASLQLPPPGGNPPVGLDPGAEPGRDDHGVEQGQDQGAPQPRPPGPPGVITPGYRGTSS